MVLNVFSVPAPICANRISMIPLRTDRSTEEDVSIATPKATYSKGSFGENEMAITNMPRRVSNNGDQLYSCCDNHGACDSRSDFDSDSDCDFEPDPLLAATATTARRSSSYSSSSAATIAIVVENSSSSSSNLIRRRVRFAPGAHPEPTTKRILRKRKQRSSTGDSCCDQVRWYTKKELKKIQQSCIFDVKTRDFMSTFVSSSSSSSSSTGDAMLDRFSEKSRKRRKLVRWQMYQTTKVVKEFESATETKVPDEFLSGLLRFYSKPMEMDAVESALKVSMVADSTQDDSLLMIRNNSDAMALHDGVYERRIFPSRTSRTTTPTTRRPTSSTGSDMTAVLSDNIDFALASTRLHLERSLRMRSPTPSP